MTANAESLTDRTVRAAKWRLASSAVGAVAQFFIGVLLARLLAPADFGLLALAFVVLGFARPLGDLGVGNAIVQRADLTERHVRTGFTVSVLLGLAVASVLAASAPWAALMLRNPQVSPVLRVLAAGFVLSGMAVVAGALLRRRLDFKPQFFIEVVSCVLGYGAITCALALRGYGVWSLVIGSLVQTLIASVAQLAYIRHSIRPCLARREVEDLLHFGVGSAASACVNYVALNADNFIVGRSLGIASLGLYNRAYTLMNVPYTYASSVMSSVLFPACAQAQGDPARLRRAFLTLTRLTAMIAAPAMVTMAIVAPHLVRGVYGERWIGVVAPLQILCIAGYFRALYHLGGIVAQSAGRVYGELRNQSLYAVLVVVGAMLGAPFALRGVAAGVGVAILVMFIVTSQLAMSVTGVGWGQYFRTQMSAFVAAALSGGAAFFVRQLLEARQAPSALIALAVLAAAALPWSASMLWALGEPGLAPFRARLGAPLTRLVNATRHLHPAEGAISG